MAAWHHVTTRSVTVVFLISTLGVYFLTYIVGIGHTTNIWLKDISDSTPLGKDASAMTTLYIVNDVTRAVMTSQPTTSIMTEKWKKRPSCEVKTDWTQFLSYPKVTTNITHWNFTDEITCDYKLNATRGKWFKQLSFICSDAFPKVKTSYKHVQRDKTNLDIQVVNFGDECMRRFVESCCYDSFRVPNVIHYVHYGKAKFEFFAFVSVISVIRFVKPCAILFHGDTLPTGSYWNDIRAIYPNIIHVKRTLPTIVAGEKMKYTTHSSDIMRLEALILYGGIYIDTDTVFVKSIDKLRSFPCTMSRQAGTFSSAFISSEKNSTFLSRWLDGYNTHYKRDHYMYNAMIYPKKLATKFQNEIHVLHGELSRPNTQHGRRVFETNYRWTSLYGIHIFKRIFVRKSKMNEETVKVFNSTVCSMCRHILYGNKELCRL